MLVFANAATVSSLGQMIVDESQPLLHTLVGGVAKADVDLSPADANSRDTRAHESSSHDSEATDRIGSRCNALDSRVLSESRRGEEDANEIA